MIRMLLVATFFAVGALDALPASAVLRRDPCRVVATERGPARRPLFRLRAARAGRNGGLAQSLWVEETGVAVAMPESAAVLEATAAAVSQLPRQDTEVWPQAAALFPAE